jgi:hypothetical protein
MLSDMVCDLPDCLDAARAKRQIAVLDEPPLVDLNANLAAAVAAGWRFEALEREMVALADGPGRMTPHEYFYYRLYDPALPRDQLWRFIGRYALGAFHAAAIDTEAALAVHDKASFYAIVAAAGLPMPRTLAIHGGWAGSIADERLGSRAALLDFLRDGTRYPLFVKPVVGMYSIGAVALRAVRDDRILLGTGETASLAQVADFIEQLGTDLNGGGFLVQELLQPHPCLKAAFGDTLPTVRLLILLSDTGAARIESAVLRIPAARNCADNYWRPGNMLGALDADGVIRRAITGVGAAGREVLVHADTGAVLPGLAVPDWASVTSLALRAAPLFPGIRTQSWDIALSDSGPLVLELNPGGDINLHQLAYRRGGLSDAYIAHLRECGCQLRHG